MIKITANDKGNPPGKLAEAELHFNEGPLEGRSGSAAPAADATSRSRPGLTASTASAAALRCFARLSIRWPRTGFAT